MTIGEFIKKLEKFDKKSKIAFCVEDAGVTYMQELNNIENQEISKTVCITFEEE